MDTAGTKMELKGFLTVIQKFKKYIFLCLYIQEIPFFLRNVQFFCLIPAKRLENVSYYTILEMTVLQLIAPMAVPIKMIRVTLELVLQL